MTEFVTVQGLKETTAMLREHLSYDPSTGNFRWVKRRRGVKFGSIAGSRNGDGYRQIEFAGKNYYGHRLAWLFTHGEWPINDTDHINGDRSDNRISNLRDISRASNIQNQKHAPINSTNGLLGVHKPKGKRKWSAGIYVDRIKRHLGCFESPEEAHSAYLEAKRLLHPGCTI